MSKLLAIILFVVINGCQTLTDDGFWYESSHLAPDGHKLIVLENRKINIMTQSRELNWVYREECSKTIPDKADCKMVLLRDVETLAQDGFGPDAISAIIGAGGNIGGAALIGSAIREAGELGRQGSALIGQGLSESGTNVNTNVTGVSSSGSNAFSGSKAVSRSVSESSSRIYRPVRYMDGDDWRD